MTISPADCLFRLAKLPLRTTNSAATVDMAADDPYINLILRTKSRTFLPFEIVDPAIEWNTV